MIGRVLRAALSLEGAAVALIVALLWAIAHVTNFHVK